MNSSILFNDKRKILTPLNKNYFFLGSLFFSISQIFIFAVFGRDIFKFPKYDTPPSSVLRLFFAFLNGFIHSDWQHVLLNMLSYFIAGLYLERKIGTLKFSLLTVVLSFFCNWANALESLSTSFRGFSAVVYGIYAYIIVEYIFTLASKEKRDLYNIIFGAIIMGLMYFSMCFNYHSPTIRFEIYPYNLIRHPGHQSGFIAGFILAFYELLSYFIYKNKTKNKEKT